PSGTAHRPGGPSRHESTELYPPFFPEAGAQGPFFSVSLRTSAAPRTDRTEPVQERGFVSKKWQQPGFAQEKRTARHPWVRRASKGLPGPLHSGLVGVALVVALLSGGSATPEPV